MAVGEQRHHVGLAGGEPEASGRRLATGRELVDIAHLDLWGGGVGLDALDGGVEHETASCEDAEEHEACQHGNDEDVLKQRVAGELGGEEVVGHEVEEHAHDDADVARGRPPADGGYGLGGVAPRGAGKCLPDKQLVAHVPHHEQDACQLRDAGVVHQHEHEPHGDHEQGRHVQ